MSTHATVARTSVHQNPHPAKRSNDPFHSPSDDDDDTWWDEEDRVDSNPLNGGIHIVDWPKPPQDTGSSVSLRPEVRAITRKPSKRYSIQKPTRDKSKGRQKKQNAKAGIKVVTDFSRHQAAAPPMQLPPSKTMPQKGCFVDLAALQALSGETTQQSGGLWRSKKNKGQLKTSNTLPDLSKNAPTTSAPKHQHNHTSTSSSSLARRSSRRSRTLSSQPSDDLSPNDRPIVIGISIPSSNVEDHTASPQTAASDITKLVRSYEHRTPTAYTPDTPTIVITPAQEEYIWSPISQGGEKSMESYHRPSSSIYSQYPQHDRAYTAIDAPPVPTMPASVLEDERRRADAQRSYFSPDSDDATTWGDDNASRSRVVSSCTIFEEDESPMIARTGRAVSIVNGQKADPRASTSTSATGRRSKGWWNYITTPFLTRSNTFTTRGAELETPPAIPSLADAIAKAQETGRDNKLWEKQFSPLTPETSTSVLTSQWWDLDAKRGKVADQSPVLQETRHKAQSSRGTLPAVLSEVAGLETATMSSITSGSPDELRRANTASTFQSNTDEALDAESLQSNNPFARSRFGQTNEITIANSSGTTTTPRPEIGTVSQPINSPSAGPPPPYSPSPARMKYKAVFPLGHALGIQYPTSPGPVSPGMQQAMSSQGSIPMSTVPLSSPVPRPINLNSGYSELPPRQNGMYLVGEHYGVPPRKPTKAEAKRRRYEREDAVAYRAGGWWRGRGCVPEGGCYGRQGAEGRKRRRWYVGLTVVLLSIVVLAVSLATTLHRRSNMAIEPSQWLNLTGFPPIFLGLSTVVAPVNIRTNTGCTFPATQWSCSLPKELQASGLPNLSNQPNLSLHVQWDNSSSANATFFNVTKTTAQATRGMAMVPVSARHLWTRMSLTRRQIVTFISNPAPPSLAESAFLGNSTDGILSARKDGEPTPFYISFLANSTATKEKRQIEERQTSSNSPNNPFPNVTTAIPPPSRQADGTAAPANLLPFPTQQPIRLYDRGLQTEHYGFYTYYDRSIFLKSLDRLNGSNVDDGDVPADRDGGATESEAAFRCTWSQTRFLVQMWTRMNTTAQLLNATRQGAAANPAKVLTQPGSFPYPITVTIDRHGGTPTLKLVYCYKLDDRQGFVANSGQVNGENRGFGGVAFNPAPNFFSNSSDPALGGFDGGTGGCSCQWSNFQSVTRS